MAFIYSFFARIVSALASYITANLAVLFPWMPKTWEANKDAVTFVITAILFFILEIIFTQKPQIDLKKARKRIGDAIFEEWRKNLKFQDGTEVKGIRINIFRLKWTCIPNFSRVPFKKFKFVYKDEGLMKTAADRNIQFTIKQGAIGKAYRTDDASVIHFLDLRGESDATQKIQSLTEKVKNGGFGLSKKQATATASVLAVATGLLVEKGIVVGAFNVDAVYDREAEALLTDSDFQHGIRELAKYADKIYCVGD